MCDTGPLNSFILGSPPPGGALTLLQEPLPVVARRRVWQAGAVAAILAVYAAGLSPHGRIKSDSALYMSLARSLAQGKGYTTAGRPHYGLPPGYPAMLAALMKLGAGSDERILALNVAMAVTGLAAVGLTYLLLRQLADRDWALLLTVVVALSREMYRRSGEILSDVPFTVLVVAGLWLYARGLRHPSRRGQWALGSALLVASCLVRVTGVIIALSAPVGLVLSAWRTARRRALLNAALIGAAVAAFVLLLLGPQPSQEDPASFSYAGSLKVWVSGHTVLTWLRRGAENFYRGAGHFCRLLTGQRMPAPVCLAVLVLPVFIALVRRARRGDWLVPATIVSYVGGISLLGVTSRYYLPLLPLLLLSLLEGWAWALAKVKLKAPRLSVAGAVLILMVGVLAANLALIGRDICRTRRADYPLAQQRGKYRDLPAVAAYLHRRPLPPGEVILSSQPVAFLADLPVPSLSTSLAVRSPSAEEMVALFGRLRVRYVVLSRQREPGTLYQALQTHLEASSEPVFTGERTVVYAIDERGRPRSRPAPAPADP